MKSINRLFVYIGSLIIVLSISFFIIYNNIKRDNKSERSSDYSSYIYFKAQHYSDTKDFSKAIELYSKLIKIDSTKGDIYYKRAYCYSQIDDFKQGINDYNKSIALNYKISNSYFNIGLNYMCLFNDSLAYTNFNLAYKYNPHDAEAKSYKDFFENRIKLKLN